MSQQSPRVRIRGNYTPMDVRVGFRVHMKRILAKLSEEELAKFLTTDSETIRRYERGLTPISSPILFHLSKLFNVPVINFFESFSDDFDLDLDSSSELALPSTFRSPLINEDHEIDEGEAGEIVRSYLSIPDAPTRRRVRELVKALAHTRVS